MKRKPVFFFFLMLILSNCQRVIIPESISNSAAPKSALFGPIVIPVDAFFHNLSLTYRTTGKEKTHIRFTMTGNIDWYLEREEPNTLHHVVFEDVEEETSYSFLPKNFPSNHLTTVQTSPYTPTKDVSFAIMRTSSSWKYETVPAFTILISDTKQIEEKDFLNFYKNNFRLAHQSILCPTFTTTIDGYALGRDAPWYWFCYGKAVVVVLKNQMPSEPLFLYLSENQYKKNFIIAIDFPSSEWEKLLSYRQVAYLIPFQSHTETLFVNVSSNIFTLYSYKK